jgi:pyruvate formate lyase activating enzyme
VDTSGISFNPDSQISVDKHEKLLDVADLFLLDIKHIDDDACKKLTGQSNAHTLAFAKFLSERGKKIWIRQVLVPGITDGEEDLKKVRAFIDTLTTVEKVEVLPYHTMGVVKYEKLGLEYPLKDAEAPSKETVALAKAILQKPVHFVADKIHLLVQKVVNFLYNKSILINGKIGDQNDK